jgi:hypothetical protein
MVASTLLAMATTGGITALSRAYAAREDAGALQQLHERAQYAFATLEPELQMAGYFAGESPPAPLAAHTIPDAATRCGTDVIRRIDGPLQVLAGWNLPCDARGGGAMTGSAVLIVRRLSAGVAAGPEPGRAQWLAGGANGGPGSLYWDGMAPWGATNAGSELRDLLVRIYYIARAADDDASVPALRVKSLTSIAGVPAFIDTEVMHGIEQLQIELLPAPSAPRTVRVRLRVVADSAQTNAREVPRTLEFTRQFTLRNARG